MPVMPQGCHGFEVEGVATPGRDGAFFRSGVRTAYRCLPFNFIAFGVQEQEGEHRAHPTTVCSTLNILNMLFSCSYSTCITVPG